MSHWPQIALLVTIALELIGTVACQVEEVPHPPFSTTGYVIRTAGFLTLLYFGGFFQ